MAPLVTTVTACLALCCLVCARAQESSTEEDAVQEAQRLRRVSGRVPRWDLRGGQVDARWCLADESGQCQWGPYIGSIFSASLSSFVLFIVFGVCLPFLCCCNPHQLCFRWQAHHGLPCCPGDAVAFTGYHQSQVNTARLGLLLSLILLALFSVTGWSGRAHVDSGIESLAEVMVSKARKVASDADDLADQFEALVDEVDDRLPAPTLEVRSDKALWLADVRRLTLGLERTERAIRTFNVVRRWMLDISLVLPVCGVGLGLIASLLNLGPAVSFWGAVSCVCMVLLWFMLLLHYPVTPVFVDICDHMDSVIEANRVSAVDSFTGCTANTFALLNEALTASAHSAATIGCAGVNEAARTGELVLANRTDCGDDELNDLLDGDELVEACGDGTTGVTLRACAEGCPARSDWRACSPLEPPGASAFSACAASCQAAMLRQAAQVRRRFSRLREDDLKPLLDCNFVVEAYREAYDAVCVRLLVGLNRVTTATTTMGACLVIPLVIMAPFSKLFRKENQHRYRRYGLHTTTYIRAKRKEAQADVVERGNLVGDLAQRAAPSRVMAGFWHGARGGGAEEETAGVSSPVRILKA